VTGHLRALGDRTGCTVTNDGASVPEVLIVYILDPAKLESVLAVVVVPHLLEPAIRPTVGDDEEKARNSPMEWRRRSAWGGDVYFLVRQRERHALDVSDGVIRVRGYCRYTCGRYARYTCAWQRDVLLRWRKLWRLSRLPPLVGAGRGGGDVAGDVPRMGARRGPWLLRPLPLPGT
jgi:hypothetical protein